ncbi:hypothetical protein C0989_011303 [Termitomyces sp. Mn162]|nr:hypothetical protein C0989_011303 [Termitomyces sp. Mn162]
MATVPDKKWHKEQHKCETQKHCQHEAHNTEMLVEPKGKPKLKKVKVILSLTSFKLGSDAVLALLGQINVALKNCLFDEDNTAPLAKLENHHKQLTWPPSSNCILLIQPPDFLPYLYMA